MTNVCQLLNRPKTECESKRSSSAQNSSAGFRIALTVEMQSAIISHKFLIRDRPETVSAKNGVKSLLKKKCWCHFEATKPVSQNWRENRCWALLTPC